MKHDRFRTCARATAARPLGLFTAALIAAAILALPSGASAQESGNVCVQDYRPRATCTANDVRIEELVPILVVEACNEGEIGVVEVVFEALVSAAGSPDRYDIGMFVALDGNSALTGDSCYHDYLAPPVTSTPVYGDRNLDGIPDLYDGPWWDGGPDADLCGDMQTNTQVFKTFASVRLVCVDQDGDGAADVSVCSSWDNNAGTPCNDVTGAFPGTGSKCSCETINFDFTPSAVSLRSWQVSSAEGPSAPWLAAVNLLALGTLAALRRPAPPRG
jgi:MYXO-CTERM domain-containing protein